MEAGQVVVRHQTSNGEVVIRYPQAGDAPAVLEYINTLSKEQTFITLQGEQKTLEEEERWLSEILENMGKGQQVYLFAAIGERIVGIAEVKLERRIESHVGSLGISVAEDFRDQGLGSRLFELVNQQAEEYLTGIRMVVLALFGTNHRAYHVYQKYGFSEYGRLPEGILHRGIYVDHVYMVRHLQPR